MRFPIRWLTSALIAALALAGCESGPPGQSPLPQARPDVPAERSSESLALARYYQGIETDLLARGLMRTDGGGPDTPFSPDDLARDFGAIAFNDEYVGPRAGSARRLGRWNIPVRVKPVFGPSVATDIVQKDTPIINDYARRLGRVSGHSVNPAKSGANFLVLVASEDDRAFVQAQLRSFIPGITPEKTALFVGVPRSIYCLVVAFSGKGTPDLYTHAVALIRAEHPDGVRRACIHEEVAQGLGLPNDSLAARPSIFNDDDEFALLTDHDELLLRMLYDPRLRPGMTQAEAMPVARILAREYMGLAI